MIMILWGSIMALGFMFYYGYVLFLSMRATVLKQQQSNQWVKEIAERGKP